MSERKSPREVARGYDDVAEAYAQLEGVRPWPRMRWLRDLLALLPSGSNVLDLGCGNGVPGTREIAKHHRVLGIDVSQRQIEWARSNVPKAVFRTADVTTLDFPADTFDAVVSFYMLGHIPREEHAALLARMFVWLRSGGYLLISVEEDEEPDTVRDWLGTPMFFSSYDADTVAMMIKETGFEIVRQQGEIQVEGSQQVPFRWVLAQKPRM